jgi:hypothetical protein
MGVGKVQKDSLNDTGNDLLILWQLLAYLWECWTKSSSRYAPERI